MDLSSHVEWTYLGFGKSAPGSIHSLLRIYCRERSCAEPTPRLRMRLRPCQVPLNGLCFPRRIKSLNSSSFWHLAVMFPPGAAAKKPASDWIPFRKCAIWLVRQCGVGWCPLQLWTPPRVSHRSEFPISSWEVWSHIFLCHCVLVTHGNFRDTCSPDSVLPPGVDIPPCSLC